MPSEVRQRQKMVLVRLTEKEHRQLELLARRRKVTRPQLFRYLLAATAGATDG